MRGLGIPAANFDSNCLDESHARPEIVTLLRERFDQALRNRDGAAPPPGRIRMLEKTPKNALRIPFLAKVFPEARFIYLHRDPHQVLSSMMEGWESGRFTMYRNLPGWTGEREWSFLLTLLFWKFVKNIYPGLKCTVLRIVHFWKWPVNMIFQLVMRGLQTELIYRMVV